MFLCNYIYKKKLSKGENVLGIVRDLRFATSKLVITFNNSEISSLSFFVDVGFRTIYKNHCVLDVFSIFIIIFSFEYYCLFVMVFSLKNCTMEKVIKHRMVKSSRLGSLIQEIVLVYSALRYVP